MDETDQLSKVLSDAAKCLAVCEDVIFWPKRIKYFLEAFEAAAHNRTKNTLRAGDCPGWVDQAFERVCHDLITRCMYKRWK